MSMHTKGHDRFWQSFQLAIAVNSVMHEQNTGHAVGHGAGCCSHMLLVVARWFTHSHVCIRDLYRASR